GFNQGPVQGGEQKASATTTLEVLLNFSEIVEVIVHGDLTGAILVRRLGRRNRRISISLPNHAQTFQRKKLVYLLNVLRSRTDQRGQPTSGDYFDSITHLREKLLKNSIH